MIHFVGEGDFTKYKAQYEARNGRLKRITQGIYCDAEDIPEEAVRAHALEIVAYLYPGARLIGRSALTLEPDVDGTLLVGHSYRGSRDIAGLHILLKDAPEAQSRRVELTQGRSIAASTLPQALLEAFHIRGAVIGGEPLARALSSLSEANERELTALASRFGWDAALERLEAARNALEGPDIHPAHILQVPLYWHGERAGELAHDGAAWSFDQRSGFLLPLGGMTPPGQIDSRVAAFLPEGWLAKVFSSDTRELLAEPRRLLGNLETGKPSGVLDEIPEGAELADWREQGQFTGSLEDLPGGAAEFLGARMGDLYHRGNMPFMSGIQVKAPMSLDAEGIARPAAGRPFTHIWKAPGAGGFEALTAVEWFGLKLCESAFPTASAALAEPRTPGGPPGLLIERFDIRRPGDGRWILATDAASLIGVGGDDKYKPSTEQVARRIVTLASDPRATGRRLYRQFIAAWLMGNGDLHAKNISVTARVDNPKKASPEVEIELSPAYDMLCTRVFASFEAENLALTVNGRRVGITPDIWRGLARHFCLSPAEAEREIEQTAMAMLERARDLLSDLPPMIKDSHGSRISVERAALIFSENLEKIGISNNLLSALDEDFDEEMGIEDDDEDLPGGPGDIGPAFSAI